jgi:ribonuclease BN (tRNA processing enzyme)
MELPPALADVATGTHDVAVYARDAGVKTLVLSHMQNNLAQPGVREKVIADVASMYKGRIIFAEELMTLDLQSSIGSAG